MENPRMIGQSNLAHRVPPRLRPGPRAYKPAQDDACLFSGLVSPRSRGFHTPYTSAARARKWRMSGSADSGDPVARRAVASP